MATSNPIGVAVGSASESVGGVMSTTGSVLDIVNDIVDNKFSIEKTITKFTLFLIARPFGKLGTSKLENSMNDALIDGFDKVLDYARDKEVGPYKKGF